MHHSNDIKLKKSIVARLAIYGIIANLETGQIHYSEKFFPDLQCYSLYLLRHAQTIGTREKCFMSDFSENAILTESGITDIEMLSNDIKKLEFDNILYSSIPRVAQTAKIMQKYIDNSSCFLEIPWMNKVDHFVKTNFLKF